MSNRSLTRQINPDRKKLRCAPLYASGYLRRYVSEKNMNTSNQKYRELRKRQLSIVLMGVIGVLIYLYLSYRDGWPIYISFLVIPVLGVLVYFSVRNVKVPILCENCEKDITAAYDNSELSSNKVSYCPYCGFELNSRI